MSREAFEKWCLTLKEVPKPWEAWQAALQSQHGEAVAWMHSCAALLTDGVELWIDNCPHCGKPRPPAQAAQPILGGDFQASRLCAAKAEVEAGNTEHALRLLDEAIRCAQAAQPQVPDGYEPTDDVVAKGAHVLSEWLNDNAPIGEHRYLDPARASFKAMLTASQEQEKS